MCGFYPVRGPSHKPALRMLDGTRALFYRDAKPLEILYGATGFMAVHRRVLEKLKDTLPLVKAKEWCWPFYGEIIKDVLGEMQWLSEDYALCDRAREAGFSVWADPSIKLQHWGLAPFEMKDIFNPDREGIMVLNRDETGYQAGLTEDTRKAVKTTDGFAIYIDPEDKNISAFLLEHGFHEPEVGEAIRQYLQPGWTFLDLGAHIGYFSLLAASRGNPVIAVEPMPVNTDLMTKSADANNFPNFVIARHAVTDWNGVIAMDIHPGNSGVTHTCTPFDSSPVEVPCHTVQTLIEGQGGRWPEFVKIDIEGDDYKVLASCPELLEHAKVMIVEVCDYQLRRQSGNTEEELKALLRDAGFHLRQLDHYSLYSNWLAIKMEPL